MQDIFHELNPIQDPVDTALKYANIPETNGSDNSLYSWSSDSVYWVRDWSQPIRNKRALGTWVAHLRMTDQLSGTFCKIMVECIMRNNSVKVYLNLGQLFRRRCHLKDFLSGALAVLLFGAENHYAILKEGIMGKFM